MDRTFWAEGYPTSLGSNVVMDAVGRATHQWMDRSYDETHHIVCEVGQLKKFGISTNSCVYKSFLPREVKLQRQ